MLRKNTASQILCFAGVNATTGAALTGASWTGRKCLDGTFSSLTATVTEDTGTGFYKVALAQGDTNANDLAYFFTATNAVPVCINALTTAADPSDTVRFGLTALPNVASGSAGAIVTAGTGTAQISTSSGQVLLQTGTGTGQLNLASGVVDANTTKISGTSQTAKDLGAINVTNLNTLSGHDPGATLGTSTLTQTQVTGGAYALNSASFAFNSALDLTTTQKASVNAEVDSALDTAIPGTPTANSVNERILTMDNNLPSDPADASDISTSFSGVTTTLSSMISTLATISGYIDTEVAAIKAKTDNLPASPAATGDIPSAASVADAVWDEAQSGHTTSGTFGKYLDSAISGVSTGGVTAADIADAVWDEARSGHTTSGTFGQGVASVQGNLTGSVGSLATQAKSDVNAEVVDALATDTYAEPGQGSPSATLSLAAKINYLFKAWRNRKTQTSTQFSLYADDATTVDQKSTVSDDGTTTVVGEIATGP